MNAEIKVLKKIDEQTPSMIKFLQDIVRIPSPEGGGHKVQGFVAKYLKEMGADKVDVFKPDIEKLSKHPGFTPVFFEHGGTKIEDKPVIVATFKGRGGGKSLMFAGHMEAATGAWEPGIVEHWEHNPWGAEIEGDALYGKSVYNMKCGNAGAIMAVRAIREAGIKVKGDIFISINIDEDIGCQGSVEAIRRGYKADAGICPEPTELTLGIGSMGCQHFRVIVKGNPTYGGGINAIENATKIYYAIKELSAYRQEKYIKAFFREHPEIETGYPLTITIGMIRAGVWPCTTPYEAVLEGSIRHVPGENIEDVRNQLRDQIRRCAEQDFFMRNNLPVVEFWEYWVDSLLDKNAPIAKTVKEAFKEIKGREPSLSISVGDAAPFTRYGNTPSVYLGPESAADTSGYYDYTAKMEGTASSAVVEESISIRSYIELTKIFALAILKWCGAERR